MKQLKPFIVLCVRWIIIEANLAHGQFGVIFDSASSPAPSNFPVPSCPPGGRADVDDSSGTDAPYGNRVGSEMGTGQKGKFRGKHSGESKSLSSDQIVLQHWHGRHHFYGQKNYGSTRREVGGSPTLAPSECPENELRIPENLEMHSNSQRNPMFNENRSNNKMSKANPTLQKKDLIADNKGPPNDDLRLNQTQSMRTKKSKGHIFDEDELSFITITKSPSPANSSQLVPVQTTRTIAPNLERIDSSDSVKKESKVNGKDAAPSIAPTPVYRRPETQSVNSHVGREKSLDAVENKGKMTKSTKHSRMRPL
jgi:hypothetical protein